MEVDFEKLERIAKQRRFEDRTMEIAKRLFIHGESPKRLSVEFGVNLKRVYAIRKEVLAAAEAITLPPGWEELRIAGPRDVIERVRRQFELEMNQLGNGGAATNEADLTG